jgi:phage terminase large subunit-like protein
MSLRDFQKAEIRKIYDNPHGTRMAIISFAKKNAKSTLAACLVLLHLAGPEAMPNTQIPSTALSKDQAAILFALAAKMVRMSPTLQPCIIVRDTIKQLVCPELGTEYKALSAEDSTAHGMSPIFAVHDELGQVRGPVSKLFNAVENAMGAHRNPLSIVISTQAANDGDLLSILIDEANTGNNPRTVLSLYAADEDLDPFSEEAIRQANPAFGDFLNADEVFEQARRAKSMPSQEGLYRNFTLNQRVDASTPFVSKTVWERNGRPAVPDFRGLDPVYAGLDLSLTTDLTAFVAVAPIEGELHAQPTFWLPAEGLADRARLSKAPYELWQRQGFLKTTPGQSVEYQYVAQFIADFVSAVPGLRKIGFDRWNMKHFRPWLVKAGLSEDQITELFVEFGQGFKDMSPALTEVETILLNAKLRHGNHPVLTMCAANSVVKTDEAGNRKLDKKRSHGRIDGMVALAMATSVASLAPDAGRGYVTDDLVVMR